MQKGSFGRRLCAFAAAACLLFAACPAVLAEHTEVTINGSCATYEGDNVGRQDYVNVRRWSAPIASYLEPQTGGGWMRVQATQRDGVVVQYYDADYRVQSTRAIPKELPLFGAFYATDDAYYLLTGQKNPERSAEVECFRLTKYDRDWNRVGAAGLFDCNTTVPFDAGSARFTQLGKYLIVRTSHEMYSGHQANVTIQFDTQRMVVTDRFTGVMNVDVGYVSHSFNQFITTENGRVVALDHGDAYPRAVVLCKYRDDASFGAFGRQCEAINVLKIAGSIGDNDTGVSIGAFEASDTAYLVAGSTVDMQASSVDVTAPRTVFVTAVDKTTNAVTMNAIATDEEAVAPHMVKLDRDTWMLLWRRDDGVAYTKINGSGQRVGEIYHVDARLSDCVPVVRDGKVIWYAWRDELTEFYEISLADWTTTRTVRVISGHQYEQSDVTETGVVTLHCTVCGATETLTVPTEFSVWWNQTDGTGNYWSYYANPLTVGDKLYYMVSLPDGAQVDSRIMELSVSDPSMIDATVWITSGELVMKKPGTVTVTIYPKYNPAAGKSYTIEIKHADGVHDFSDEWRSNGDGHFHECACGERADAAAHEFAWVIDREPTETEAGVKHEACTVCGFVRNADTVIDRLPHTHIFADAWSADAATHFHACACGERADVAAHEFAWVVDREPTETEAGVKHEACAVCGYVRNADTSIPPLSHVHELAHTPAKAATRDETGNIEYWYCAGCDKYFADADAAYEIMRDAVVLPVLAMLGDVNGDGAVDTADAVLVLQYAAKLIGKDSLDVSAADVNGDGAIDTADAVLILQYAAKLIERFPGAKS